MDDQLTVTAVEDEAGLERLSPEWNRLVERSHAKSVFLTWEWIECWWQVYGGDFDLLTITVHRDGELCGIAPMVIRKGPEPRLEFIGQNRAYGEYLDFIVPAGLEAEVSPAICRKLAEIGAAGRWRSMSLAVVRSDSPNFGLLRESFARCGYPLSLSAPRPSPVTALPASWEAYIRAMPGKVRRQMQQAERRLAALGAIHIEAPASLAEADGFFDDFIDLHNRRWNHEQDAVFLVFHRRLVRRLFPLGRLLLLRMTVAGKPAAIEYSFVFDNRVFGYQGGWDPALARLSIGNQMICAVFRHCIAQGISAYDFLEGESPFKNRWSSERLVSYDVTFGAAGQPFVFQNSQAVEDSVLKGQRAA